MTTVASDFIHLCNEYRKNDSVASTFADVVDQRLNQSYLSEGRLLDTEVWPPIQKIRNRFTKIVGNNKSQCLVRLSNPAHLDRFKDFLTHLDNHINSTMELAYEGCDTPGYCSLPEGEEENEDFVLFHAYIVVACRGYFCCKASSESWSQLRSFVQNIVTRSYRLPLTARYLNALASYFRDYEPPCGDEEFGRLCDTIRSMTTG